MSCSISNGRNSVSFLANHEGTDIPLTHVGVGILVVTSPIPIIIASRAIIPSSICDISITIGKRNISARVLYLGLFVVFTVDSKFLPPSLPIPNISNKLYKVGDMVELYGLNGEHQVVQRRTEIRMISAISTPESSTPSWRVINTEGYAFSLTLSTLPLLRFGWKLNMTIRITMQE
jgi:hypothetical protein